MVPIRSPRLSQLLSPLLLLLIAAGLSLVLACGTAEEASTVAESGEENAGEENASEGSADQKSASERPALPEGPPIDGFKQLMPRGGIPALVDPQFVTASAAKMPDSAWIMGFEHQGQAYAYDLNILNHHEVVNHKIGELPIAAVW